MKTRILLIIFLSGCITSALYSQNVEPIIAKVMYKFSHKRDTTNLDNIYTESMILLLSKSSSVYKSYDRSVHDSVLLEKIKKGGGNNIEPPSTKLGSGTEIYLYPIEKKAYQQDFLINKYIYPIDYPTIHWRIVNDTISIAGLKCQKAIGNWKGRTYEVWFCPKIPFSFGPWKLSGLPGLIIKAWDQKKQVMFDFVEISKYSGNDILNQPSKSVIKTTQENYLKLQEAFYENPTAFMKNAIPGIKSITLGTPYVRKPPINNPLELTKK